MKRLIVLSMVLVLINILGAFEFEHSGELRTRSKALYDDVSENLDAYIDSRLQLNLDANLYENLDLRAAFEVGDFTWGDSWPSQYYVETNEAYVSYHIESFNANLKVGKQYWADHRGLVFDDFIPAIMLNVEDIAGFKAELGIMKYQLNGNHSTWYMANVSTEAPIAMGLTGLIGNADDIDLASVSVQPYATMAFGPINVDINPFLDYQYAREEFGFGIAVKGDITVSGIELGGDILFAGENGITTLSSWYQNGLYLYGIGKHHDGVNMYWSNPYEFNTDTFLSIVANAKYTVNDDLKVFAAAGLLTDIGLEGNAGVEYQIVPDHLSIAGFGALGIHDTPEQLDIALGANLKLEY